MDIKHFASYFNPKSSKHYAVEDFKQLKGWQMILTATVTAISVPLLLGFGSVALFRVLTKSFKAKPLNVNENSTKLDQSASKADRSRASISGSTESPPVPAPKVSSTESSSSIEPGVIAPQPSSGNFCIRYDRYTESFIIGKDRDFVKRKVPYLFEGHDPVYKLADGSPMPIEPGDYLIFVSTWAGEEPLPKEREFDSGLFLPGTLIRDMKVGSTLQLQRNGQPYTLTLSVDSRLQRVYSHEEMIGRTETWMYDVYGGAAQEPVLPGRTPLRYPHIKFTVAAKQAEAALKAQIALWLTREDECHTYAFNVSTQKYEQRQDFTWNTDDHIRPTHFEFAKERGLFINIPGAKELILSIKGNELFAHYKGIGGMLFGCILNLDEIGITPKELLEKQVNLEQLKLGVYYFVF